MGATGTDRNLLIVIELVKRMNSGGASAGGGRSGESAPELAKMQKAAAKRQEPRMKPSRRGLE